MHEVLEQIRQELLNCSKLVKHENSKKYSIHDMDYYNEMLEKFVDNNSIEDFKEIADEWDKNLGRVEKLSAPTRNDFYCIWENVGGFLHSAKELFHEKEKERLEKERLEKKTKKSGFGAFGVICTIILFCAYPYFIVLLIPYLIIKSLFKKLLGTTEEAEAKDKTDK